MRRFLGSFRSFQILGRAFANPVLYVCLLLAYPAPAFEDRIIAVVNKDVITWSDLEEKVRDEYKRLKAKYQGEDLERRFIQKQREILNFLIEERLQIQEAKAKGYDVTQEEIDDSLQRAPLLPGQTQEDYRNKLLMKKVFDFEVRRSVVVEDEEIERFYENNPTIFKKPPHYHLKQILITAQKEYERELARNKANSIHASWKPESSLEDLSSQFIVHLEDLGWVQEDELQDPLSTVIKQLKPGELSQPVETELGFHLLAIEEISDTRVYKLEEVEQEVRALLHKQKTEEAYRDWLADLKKKAFIEVKY